MIRNEEKKMEKEMEKKDLLKKYGAFLMFIAICNLRTLNECINRIMRAVNAGNFNLASIFIGGIALVSCVAIVFCVYTTVSLSLTNKKLKKLNKEPDKE